MTARDLMRLVASRGGKLRVDRRGRVEVAGPSSLVFDPQVLSELSLKRIELAILLRSGGRA